MTYRSDQLRHDCGRDGCKVEQEPDLSWLSGCFPRSIMPSDIDGMVEINGHFLFIEYKGPGGKLKDGQRIALKRLGGQTNVTVVVLRERAEGFDQLIWSLTEDCRSYQVRTRDQVAAWFREWVRQAQEVS